MVATNTTTNFNFNLTTFDKIPWQDEAHNNWHIVDALIARYLSVSNVQGAWENALAVTVGQRYIDIDLDTIYEVLIAHTTPSTGTFAAARTATAVNWQSVTVDPTFRGAWADATVYSINDFVSDGTRYGVVAVAHTSATSYDTGVTAGNITTLIDLSTTGTSTSSLSIAVASKTFTTQANKNFIAGDFVLITSDANTANYMHGSVTSYTNTSLVVNVTNVGGSGTLADWTIRMSGSRGATGATGATGSTGAAGADADIGLIIALGG